MFELLMKAMLLGESEVPDGNADSLQKALEEHKHPSQVFEEAENVGLKGQILTLQGAIEKFAKERELLAEEVGRLQEEISNFKKENTRLWHENERFRSENQNLKRVLRRQDEKVADLKARLSNLYTKLEAARSGAGSSADEEADESSVSAGRTDKVGDSTSADKVDETSVSAGAETGGDERTSDGKSADEADGSSGGENISASSESMSFCTDK